MVGAEEIDTPPLCACPRCQFGDWEFHEEDERYLCDGCDLWYSVPDGRYMIWAGLSVGNGVEEAVWHEFLGTSDDNWWSGEDAGVDGDGAVDAGCAEVGDALCQEPGVCG